VIPFITEELWQVVRGVAGKEGASISVAPYPEANAGAIDTQAEAYVARIKLLIDKCRSLRGELGVSAAERLPLYATGDAEFLRAVAPALKVLGKLSEVRIYDDEIKWSEAITADTANSGPVAEAGDIRLCLLVQVDVAAEKARLSKEADRLRGELAKANGKLANEAFVAKAPPAVIEQERKRIADFTATLEKVQGQLKRLG
jgi:valyl-tRNA synthetase